MSVLRRGGSRRARVLVTVMAVAAFQVLAIVGAGVASATGACTYNPATDTINITIDAGTDVALTVETTADDLDNESPAGAILFSQGAAVRDYENLAASTQCGSASITNTVAIIVLGQPSDEEIFLIDEWSTSAQFPTSIAWAIDLGSQGVGLFDEFWFWANEGANPGPDAPFDDTVVVTNSSFDINGGIGELVGVESIWVDGGFGDDVIDGSALTSVFFDSILNPAGAEGADGADWIAPGSATGDVVDGGAGTDQLSYGTRTTSTTILPAVAGFDANADCALVAPEEIDTHSTFEVFESGSGNDCLVGDGDAETFIPGDGDDDITGAGGVDTLDYSSSSAGMVIDPALGTAAGQGSDTFNTVEGFVGSAFDDSLIWPNVGGGGISLFAGGDGIDTVDASATTAGQAIDLDTLDGVPVGGAGAPPDSTENAIGGTGNDTLTGNDLRNDLDGADGDDVMSGAAGNDTLRGGLGNDTFGGGTGADRISFANSPNKVTVDMNLGFATGEGDDGFLTAPVDVEVVQGSAFNDTITGGGGIIAINFLFSGAAGNDRLTGSGSNDTLRGGAGNDKMRGLEGGDTLRGGPGARDRAWGGPQVDFCKAERETSCEA